MYFRPTATFDLYPLFTPLFVNDLVHGFGFQNEAARDRIFQPQSASDHSTHLMRHFKFHCEDDSLVMMSF